MNHRPWLAQRLVPILALSIVAVVGAASARATSPQAAIVSPDDYFGFQMGADRKLARWDKLVTYYEQLAAASPRMLAMNVGPSTLDNPFLVLFISAPENLEAGRLDELQRLNATLNDPRAATDAAIEAAITDGKAVVVQSMGLHSTEVAASQMAAELAYDLVTRTDDEIMRILDNTISIIIPCFNPDGEILVTDWYNETVGTEYEGVSPPSLYHHYIGHDNNRDAFQTNTVESVYGAQLMFRDWIPQAYIDHHQMGAYGARIYVPPYAEPIRPGGDPLVWREMSWYGAHIAYKEEEAGVSGVVNAAVYSGWGHFGFHWITPFHNIAGMLTESASARLATPLFLHPDQLNGETRGLPKYEAQTTFPNPWPGGWWRVRDIVVQQKIAALAALDLAARNRETVLRSAYLKASRQTQRGVEGKPAAFVVPAAQHDLLTATKMINKLRGQGIEVHRSDRQFTHEGRAYDAGSYVISMAQPKRGVIRWLLGRTFYPDNTYTRSRDGDPIRPYDMSTDTMSEFMGVRVDPIDTPVESGLSIVTSDVEVRGSAVRGRYGYVIDGRLNDAFTAMNLLLDNGVPVRRVTEDLAGGVHAGDFVVSSDVAESTVRELAERSGVEFAALDVDTSGSSYKLERQRIGMYQRYYGGNMDEGWTRLLLEMFGFPYATLMDPDIVGGALRDNYDVLILPADSPSVMIGEGDEDGFRGRRDDWPAEYRSALGQEGVDALEAFVQAGGTLITFAQAGELAIEKFDLPIRNIVDDAPSREFWSPGSTLRVDVDRTNTLAYGMPTAALATFLQGNQVYRVVPSARNHHVERIVTFVDRDILQSGWLLGEDVIANMAAMVSVSHGEGRVVLIGFRAQHRAQTHGTFKLVFNALVSAPSD
ncbi:MAG TPA: M14 family metallopeptidase [Acidobacteriota bacterium]|nr:M14 family metallopeptidase [Acidobacteriota bacterium]